MNTLIAKLSANPKILRDYIDWIYKVHVPQTGTKFRSISFITKDETVNYYKLNILLAGQKNLHVDRSTPLPANYVDVFRQAGANINTYGDLAFVAQMDPIPDNIAQALEKLCQMGFDKSVLKRIV